MERDGCPLIEQLSHLLADDLPAEERDRLSAHVGNCPPCQERAEQLLADASVLAWRRTMAARTEPGPPEEFLSSMRRLVPLVAASMTLARPPNGGTAPDVPSHHEPEPCPQRIGGYEILGVLGRGGMSVVYKARQPGLGRVVALKRLIPHGPIGPNTARFLREAAAVARMHHPNIVQVYEAGEDEGRPFLALEHVPGGTLAEYLEGAPADPREAAELLEKVARAIHHAHEQGIVHRDLKPSNILLAGWTRENREAGPGPPAALTPKVSDFGLARAMTEDQSLTLSGVVVGTPAYVAPEVIRQPGPPTAAADVYALGVILYEMLTGRPPLLGPTALATIRLVEEADPVPPSRLQPHLPRDLETICLKCLGKEPERRYSTARELADDLGRFLQGDPIRARPSSLLERLTRWCQRPERVAFAGKLAIFTYGLLAVWKVLAMVLVVLGFGIGPRDVAECLIQILAMIGILNVPHIGIGFAVLGRWPPALWIGTFLAVFHLVVGSVCLLTGFLTFGGLLEDSNVRWLVYCLLIIPACFTLLAYVVALIAQYACRPGIR